MLKVRKDPSKGQIPLLGREYYLTWLRNISLELAGFDLSNLNAALEGSMSLHSLCFIDRLELVMRCPQSFERTSYLNRYVDRNLIPAAILCMCLRPTWFTAFISCANTLKLHYLKNFKKFHLTEPKHYS